ncbi:hypothetical protein ACN27F_25895 [Solwaraspora sp. WMMB335]|uniref:hypothetical protein n=1 Tax=Solwaraspora sp. WMMB335 TaxID=3404118 RepID=UPI003B93CFF1
MRKVHAIIATVALTGALVLTGGTPALAAPAQSAAPAAAPGVAAAALELQGVYYDRDFCVWYGNYGAANGLWGTWYCEFQPNAGSNGLWFLWAWVD